LSRTFALAIDCWFPQKSSALLFVGFFAVLNCPADFDSTLN
jgi:hypothetical protein